MPDAAEAEYYGNQKWSLSGVVHLHSLSSEYIQNQFHVKVSVECLIYLSSCAARRGGGQRAMVLLPV